jgi:hypothetical protein
MKAKYRAMTARLSRDRVKAPWYFDRRLIRSGRKKPKRAWMADGKTPDTTENVLRFRRSALSFTCNKCDLPVADFPGFFPVAEECNVYGQLFEKTKAQLALVLSDCRCNHVPKTNWPTRRRRAEAEYARSKPLQGSGSPRIFDQR